MVKPKLETNLLKLTELIETFNKRRLWNRNPNWVLEPWLKTIRVSLF